MEKLGNPLSLFIGIPTYGLPKPEFTIDSLGDLLFHIGRRHSEIELMYHQRDVRTYRQAARGAIVDGARQVAATHLLMLDDDHDFRPNVFDILWNAIHQSDVKMVSALYFTRGRPTVPCIWKLTARGTVPIFYYPENELIPVDVVGFGMVLFDMTLFERLNPPWFDLGIGFGEDAAFCDRVLSAGLKVWCHTGAKIGHINEQPQIITEADYFKDREEFYERLKPELAVITPAGPAARERNWWGSPRHDQNHQSWWRPGTSRRGGAFNDLGTLAPATPGEAQGEKG